MEKVTAGLPCQGDTARNLSAILSSEALDARRWQIFCAIEELLRGRSPESKTETGNPSIKAFPSDMIEDRDNQYVAKVEIRDGKMEAHAESTEKFWGKVIGPLRYLPEKEAQLKALSARWRNTDAVMHPVGPPSSLPPCRKVWRFSPMQTMCSRTASSVQVARTTTETCGKTTVSSCFSNCRTRKSAA